MNKKGAKAQRDRGTKEQRHKGAKLMNHLFSFNFLIKLLSIRSTSRLCSYISE